MVLVGERVGRDLSRWYAIADVFAFPSLSETFGNVVLEAKASGLPVVAFDCPAIRERVMHCRDGLLVPADGEMTGALYEICRCRGTRLGNAARRKAQGQAWAPIFDALEDRNARLVAESAGAKDAPIAPIRITRAGTSAA
jgi:glycosyltransferase involved in cell wall biosynthesis